MEIEWREYTIKKMETVGHGLFDMDHALFVEKAAIDIIHSYNGSISNIEFSIIICAALLHDIGFSQISPKWSLDAFEHIQSSKDIASQILSSIPYYCNNPSLINQVLFLIEHHDDTTFSFPSANNCGRPLLYKKPITQSTALKILQEADAQTHAVGNCLSRTLQTWELNHLPACNSFNEKLIPSWNWHESIISNLRILSKRVILDSFTQNGKLLALKIYNDLEFKISNICKAHEIKYVADTCHPKFRQDSIERLASKHRRLEILAFHSWSEIVDSMRLITLKDDNTIHPYEHAKIEFCSVSLEGISPMALYVMKTRLEEILEFHDSLMVDYCWSIWDLPGILEFRYNSEEIQKIAPPVVEFYEETAFEECPKVLGLLDGLHRCTVARRIGQKRINAIVTSDVPYPLEPLPVKWEQIKECNSKPRIKKHYRYSDWKIVPTKLKEEYNTLTEDNFKSFFYRDLGPIGSAGKRDFYVPRKN